MASLQKWAIGGVVAVAAGWFFYSPYHVLSKLEKAGKAGDAEYINAHVEYPSVRSSLKESFNRVMFKGVTESQQQNGFALAGMAFASMIADKMVDALVTPEGVMAMLKGRVPGDGAKKEPESAGAGGGQAEVEQLKPQMGYDSLNVFKVKVENDKSRVLVTLARDGVFDWKLTRVDMEPR
ncbi:protein of unknown function [Pseudogulbenkiania sp. NH8B]|uniref:DUF2939 domain-containing protein n=1 Tax=Pseudogulbenkiania sp. (strain NH8B) TaxID=748280 RepID=UPI0002279FE8|nr:DUF2939 domain-containing protein [Pseudogulbenkiania sp. NH8B]BAK76762.1 protein of unknown function [Pseudogulbenkiania sp. NH8B]